MELFTLKLITRSWWRNKIFFFISLLSLSIGLACTNLLLTFFIYEYNIESNLPDKEQIVCLQQDAPMQEGAKVSYAVGTIPALLKDKFAEIEEWISGSISFGDTYLQKGENMRLLQQRFQLKSPVYIGDTDGDGVQARLAGWPFVFVRYGFGSTDRFDLAFDSFSELTDYFMNLS